MYLHFNTCKRLQRGSRPYASNKHYGETFLYIPPGMLQAARHSDSSMCFCRSMRQSYDPATAPDTSGLIPLAHKSRAVSGTSRLRHVMYIRQSKPSLTYSGASSTHGYYSLHMPVLLATLTKPDAASTYL